MSPTLQALPANWGSRNQVERLTPAAAASLSRVMMRAVAETGSIFNLNDGYRSYAEQVRLFKANYRNRGTRSKKASTDRMFAGTAWRWLGSVKVASPDLYGTGTGANHTKGLAIDVVPAPIQGYLQRDGLASGWSWEEGKRNGEPWHFVYIESKDQYRHEGFLDHAAVQRVVGAKVDGKIGPDTAGKIREWQKAHGLTADGKVGTKTKAAMGLGGGDAAPALSAPAGGASVPKPDTTQNVTAPAITIEVPGDSPNANQERFGQEVETITFHWWGEPEGQTHDGTVDYLLRDRGANGTSAHYVVSEGRVSRCVPEEWTAWSSGKRAVNRSDISVECDPNNVIGTLPTAAALLTDIWTRYPDAEVHVHSDWVSTECNGDYRDLMPELIALAKGQTVELPTTPEPAAVAALPTGKALLVKLTNCPDFPLLRTPAHLCYYGDEDKREAVSGKVPNSLVPGEVCGSGRSSGAQGLKRWQAKAGIEADGRFGKGTERKVREVQKRAGLKVDGKLGPDAWYALWLIG
ncbi:peptidoglycan-binding protein [Brachybacterium paraconglomeratum]